MRILFFATYPTQPTGYARIGNILSNALASAGHEVHYLGISNFSNLAIERDIHPFIQLVDALAVRKEDSTELYGVDVICQKIQEIQPDLVFLYNDMIVLNRILNKFIDTNLEKKFKLCIYLDLVYEYQRLLHFQNVQIWADLIYVFSDCWQQHLLKLGVPSEKIAILPHGIDTRIFQSLDSSAAKREIGFASTDFIFLNSNRNAYRKAHDITIEAFLKLLIKYNYEPDLKLFLNMLQISPQGYNLLELIQVICLKNSVDFDRVVLNHIFIRPSDSYLPDAKLNDLYNACDVGLNTCLGEGFGLCNLEQACVGKPQIVSKVSGLADIFQSDYATLITPQLDLYLSPLAEEHQGYIQICSSQTVADAMERYYLDRQLANQHGALAQTVLTKKYEWVGILTRFQAELLQLCAT
jgi:glycosyltransferase involved in cell wall biosynthesis